jgi:nucleoid DNA-binding protein
MTDQVQPTGHLNHVSLIEAVAAESGVSRATVRKVLRATFDVVGRTVAKGYEVRVTNFGTWHRKTLDSTRNPKTGEQAGPTASMGFRSNGRVREWVRSGVAGATLRKTRSHGGH